MTGHGQVAGFCKQCFIETQPCPLVSVLSVAIFALQQHSGVVVLNIIWLTILKHLLSDPLRKSLLIPGLEKINESEVGSNQERYGGEKAISEIKTTLTMKF